MIIIKVPGINGFGRTEGCRNAGNAIIESLDGIYSNESGKPIDRKLLDSSKSKDFDGSQKSLIFDVEEIHVDNKNLEEQENLIYENALEAIEKQDKIIFLGGDHSISFSIVKAFMDYFRENKKEICLIIFDAHPDCMPEGRNPSHEEWLRALVEKGFNPRNILLVGSRNSDAEEIKFLANKKIKSINMNELNNNMEEITDGIMEFSSGKELYVSFDIDVVDPAFAFSTGCKEPGGLTSRQAIYIVSRIAKMKNLRAFDLVEVDNEKDKNRMTVKLAAKLFAELL